MVSPGNAFFEGEAPAALLLEGATVSPCNAKGGCMGLFNGGWKGNILGGLAIGIGSAVLAPVVIPIISRTAKPLTKAAIKGALLMYEKGKEKVAEAQEVVEDLMAEARSELDKEASARVEAEAGSELEE
jgi:hypothetical protein